MSGISFTYRNEVNPALPERIHLHQALFYDNEREYLDGILGFITPALNAGEPVAAAIPPERGDLLRAALNGFAGEVEILDVFEIGRNPARLIPAVEQRLARGDGALLHYVEEPIWPGRTPEEIQEATRHEALINLAWPSAPVRVLCAYDCAHLPPEVLADAERTHPRVIERGHERRSAIYSRGVPLGSKRALPPAPPEAIELAFGLDQLPEVRAVVADHAASVGLSRDRVQDLVLAVSELAANAIRHGRGRGRLRRWTCPDRLICQIDDRGHIRDPLAGHRPPPPNAAGGIGLWAVNQLCDLVEVRSGPDGTSVRVHTGLR